MAASTSMRTEKMLDALGLSSGPLLSVKALGLSLATLAPASIDVAATAGNTTPEKVGVGAGAIVLSVAPGSVTPVRADDVITDLGGLPVQTARCAQGILSGWPAKQPLRAKVLRHNELRTLWLVTGSLLGSACD